MEDFDVIIIGAGAAGLAAALYTTRRTLSTLVISGDLGGQTATTNDIENYPGIDFATGPDLMNRFAEQAKKFGAVLKYAWVAGVKQADGKFQVELADGTNHVARSLIIASGKKHRHLDVPGEAEFANKGVVYCATCDAPLFEGKSVVVVGGGSAAFDAALLLSKIAKDITLIHRRDTFRAEDILVQKAQAESKINFLLNTTVKEIHGDKFVNGLTVTTPEGDQTIAVEGIFVEVGQIVDTAFLGGLVELAPTGEIAIDNNNQTSLPGIFAAGDITTVPFKQTVISAGEGAKAALAAYNYILGRDPGTQFADQGYIK
jgi:thioredoxin-disulfide reductase